jgi:DNA-binding NarL/FixJ family response regulator
VPSITRILVADKFPVLRVGLCAVIEERPTWKVIAEAADGTEAIRVAIETRPDVAILGHRVPGMDAVAVTSKLREVVPEAEVLIFAINVDGTYVRAALNAGARGYVLKSDGKVQLAAAIEALIEHEPFLTEKVSRLLSALAPANGHQNGTLLTKRERDVLRVFVEGELSKEIAHKLGIGARTVETHRSGIMQKLDVSSTAGLVRYAVRAGMIEP